MHSFYFYFFLVTGIASFGLALYWFRDSLKTSSLKNKLIYGTFAVGWLVLGILFVVWMGTAQDLLLN